MFACLFATYMTNSRISLQIRSCSCCLGRLGCWLNTSLHFSGISLFSHWDFRMVMHCFDQLVVNFCWVNLGACRRFHLHWIAGPSWLHNYCRMMIVVGIVYFPMMLWLVPKNDRVDFKALKNGKILLLTLRKQNVILQSKVSIFGLYLVMTNDKTSFSRVIMDKIP